jgi:hypothetical protein
MISKLQPVHNKYDNSHNQMWCLAHSGALTRFMALKTFCDRGSDRVRIRPAFGPGMTSLVQYTLFLLWTQGELAPGSDNLEIAHVVLLQRAFTAHVPRFHDIYALLTRTMA